MKTVILVDFSVNGKWEFVQSVKTVLKGEVEIKQCINNQPLTNLIKKVAKYMRYFVFPLKILLLYKDYDIIIGWQQFFGLNLAFWLRLFHIKKKGKLIVMTFIYKPKKGIAGKVYHSYMSYIIQSGYIDKCIVFSKGEVSFYTSIFQANSKMFEYVPLGIGIFEKMPIDISNEQKYIFSTGRSNRDYDFLYNAICGTEFVLKIACDTYAGPPRENIDILTNCYGSDMRQKMAESYCVVVPLKEITISSGQLVILQAMQLKKPVIATRTSGSEDYIINGYNGFLIDNTQDQLLQILRKLYKDRNLYNMISTNAYRMFLNQHSIKQMGTNIGRIVTKLLKEGVSK